MIGIQLPWQVDASTTPTISMLTLGMHLGWAFVLGAITTRLLQRAPHVIRTSAVAAIILISVLPSEWSPSWWLGLAFQTPSVSLQCLCVLYLYRTWRINRAGRTLSATSLSNTLTTWPTGLLLVAIAFGWLLALDTFAQFQLALYAIGFSPYAVLAALLFACLLQLISTRSGHAAQTRHYRELAGIVLIVILIYLFTRLPSGNMWDALLDPWLWLWAHLVVLHRLKELHLNRLK